MTVAIREDIRSTWGGSATPTTPAILDGFRAGIARLVAMGRAEGMPIEFVHAHRQSSASRRSDPGERLWREVVLYMAPELGLRCEPALALRDGRPIPREWDPMQRAPY